MSLASELIQYMLMREVSGGMNMCLEDTKEEMKGHLGDKNEGKLVIFFDTGISEQIDCEAWPVDLSEKSITT